MEEDQRLFVDKYAPQSFTQIKFNEDLGKMIESFAISNNMPHMILRGSQGSGRKTFANLYIRSHYKLSSLSTKYRTVEIKIPSKIIELQLLYSGYHYQIEPSIHGVYDRIIIQGFIKDMLQTRPISNTPYHIIIINNADQLTIEAQQSLRRTLEKNMDNSRFIFIVSHESNLIDPLVSRCIQFRLSSPTNQQIVDILEQICIKEHINYIFPRLSDLAKISQRNITHAINLLQFTYLNHNEYLTNSGIIKSIDIDVNESYIDNMCHQLMISKSIEDVKILRKMIYELLGQCIEPIILLKKIFVYVLDHTSQVEKQYKIVDVVNHCEGTLKMGSKPIYHIELMCLNIIKLLSV